MDEEEYVRLLECLVILLAKNDHDIWEALMGMKGNDAWTQVPMIQGMLNIYIGMIANFEFDKDAITYEGIKKLIEGFKGKYQCRAVEDIECKGE